MRSSRQWYCSVQITGRMNRKRKYSHWCAHGQSLVKGSPPFTNDAKSWAPRRPWFVDSCHSRNCAGVVRRRRFWRSVLETRCFRTCTTMEGVPVFGSLMSRRKCSDMTTRPTSAK